MHRVDTRTKILNREQAAERIAAGAANGPVRIIAGFFDPLTAGHARRIEEIARGAAVTGVVVLTPEGAILAPRARAELVAALGAVDFVVEAGSPEELACFSGADIFRDDESEARLTRELIRHVHDRQSAR